MFNVMPTSYRSMVATPHHLASAAGSLIMHRGGNAFDAAVVISAVLAVVYPHMTGLGGDCFFLMYNAKEQKVIGLNGSGRSGSRATPDIFSQSGHERIPDRGVQSALTVPGMVDAWWQVWSKYGRLPWEQLLTPAADYAKQGFPISRNLQYWIAKDKHLLRKVPRLSEVFLDQGEPLKEGDRLIQPDLAATLRLLISEGRDAFYQGEIMKMIVEAIRRDGGLLTEEDFLSHRSEWVPPVSTTYRGNELYQMPPNSQGFSVLMMMNMLEHCDLGAVPRDSAEFYHLAVEVVKRAFSYRDRYLTDPDFSRIPMEELLSKDFAKNLYDRIDWTSRTASSFASSPMGQDTAYAAVVDEEGNAVSFIQSLYYDFGSGYAAGKSGVIMQNRGSYFSLDPEHPNVLEPKKRSFHTLMPGMVLRGGKPYLLLGTQGGEGQPQTSLSILTGVLDYKCTIQEAIALPRWVYGRTWGQSSDSLKMENRGPEYQIAKQLRRFGHEVELAQGWDGIMGQAQGIMISEDGVISGAADPRGDGLAIGW